MTRRIGTYFTLALLVLVAFAPTAKAENAKNIILMISDGLGFNGWEAAKYYEGSLPYDNSDFTFHGMTTYMNNVRDLDTGNMLDSDSYDVKSADAALHNWQAVPQGYDAGQMWTDFEYHRNNESYNGFTDSAAAATAMYTGTKTYNSAVSYSVEGQNLKTIAEIAAEQGKATGAVSSVQFSHATPAAVYAHTYYRYNKTEIATQAINSDLDVLMGGDAYVDTEGEYPGAVAGFKADAAAMGFNVIDTPQGFTDLASGTNVPSGKVLGTFSGSTLGGRPEGPTLQEMTTGALQVLEQDADGFFLMVEGGAIDWENHANDAADMMREQVDFDNSVEAVMNWIETEGGGWDENLLIVTSDHETGCIWGPDSGIVDVNGTPDDPSDDEHVFNPVIDNGEGNLPGMEYYSGGHTNPLVPMWARGAGQDLFDALADESDAQAAAFWTQFDEGNWDGSYIDNTEIFGVMNQVVPEPATMTLLALGGLGALMRRRRR
jgi:alkaline phosphatase